MNLEAGAPIGIFDSGIGGLTVAHAIKELLPDEQLIYFGDTAHLPYGDKSTAAIQAYSVKIADFLIRKGCKVIVVACNSASASANELLKEYTASRAKVINVIDPIVDELAQNGSTGQVGVIGTRRTIDSRVYSKKVLSRSPGCQVHELAAPLLVPMIEEGFLHNKVSQDILQNYLGDKIFDNISSLVLGCTHYPLIGEEIRRFFDNRVKIINSSQVTARALATYLKEQSMLASTQERNDIFYVSDYTLTFEHQAKRFFGEPVVLKEYRLWE